MLDWHLDLLQLHVQLVVSDSPYEIIGDGSDEVDHWAYGLASSHGLLFGRSDREIVRRKFL